MSIKRIIVIAAIFVNVFLVLIIIFLNQYKGDSALLSANSAYVSTITAIMSLWTSILGSSLIYLTFEEQKKNFQVINEATVEEMYRRHLEYLYKQMQEILYRKEEKIDKNGFEFSEQGAIYSNVPNHLERCFLSFSSLLYGIINIDKNDYKSVVYECYVVKEYEPFLILLNQLLHRIIHENNLSDISKGILLINANDYFYKDNNYLISCFENCFRKNILDWTVEADIYKTVITMGIDIETERLKLLKSKLDKLKILLETKS